MTVEASGERAPGRAAAWITASAFVLLISQWVTIPGINEEALSEIFPELLGPFGASPQMFSAIGLSTAALVGARLVLSMLGKSESGVARSIAFSIYLLITMVQALSVAFWMESMGYEVGFIDLVREPGWKFRLTAVLACTTGAAILWWLADRIDATRAATGALAIALLTVLLRFVVDAPALAEGFAIGAEGLLATAAHLVLPGAMLVLAIMLALRAPASWPVKLTGSLELRSPLDVLAIPATVVTLAGASIGPLAAPELVRAGAVIAATLALAMVLRARVTEVADRRLLWPAGLAIGALAIVMVPMTLGLVTSGVLARTFEPGPLEGEARFTIRLAAVDRFRDDEAQAMVDHLNALGAQAAIVSADARQITLRVEAASDTQSVLDALRPHSLALHLVEDFPSVPLPEGARLDQGTPEGPCDALASFAPTVTCQTALERVVETDEGEVMDGAPRECRLRCLAPSAVVTGADVADAQVVVDQYSGAPVVSVTLTESAGDRFEEVTAANLRRQLAIVVDGEIVSAPIIQSPIPGGRIQITLGGARGYEAVLREADTLVAALRSGEQLSSEWTLDSIEQ
jgi:hypothetical protein